MNGRRAKDRHRRELAERRRAARYKLRHAMSDAENFGYMVGWAADLDHVPEVRKQTHDRLIVQLGDRRRSGVVWVQWSGDEAGFVLAELSETCGDEMREYLRQMKAKVREYGGYVVMARAAAEPPESRT